MHALNLYFYLSMLWVCSVVPGKHEILNKILKYKYILAITFETVSTRCHILANNSPSSLNHMIYRCHGRRVPSLKIHSHNSNSQYV